MLDHLLESSAREEIAITEKIRTLYLGQCSPQRYRFTGDTFIAFQNRTVYAEHTKVSIICVPNASCILHKYAILVANLS